MASSPLNPVLHQRKMSRTLSLARMQTSKKTNHWIDTGLAPIQFIYMAQIYFNSNFNFRKLLVSSKFNNDSMSMEVKKKNSTTSFRFPRW